MGKHTFKILTEALEGKKRQTKSNSKWHLCSASDGKCRCGMISDRESNYLVATVTITKWGEYYPCLDKEGNPSLRFDSYGEISEEIGHANARLIASAPDLLEALKRIKEQCHGLIQPGDIQDIANDAIDQAEANNN